MRLLGELRAALRELADANIAHEEAMTQTNFTEYRPGAWATRAEVQTSTPNL